MMSLFLLIALGAGAVSAFFMEWPFVKEIFTRDLCEGDDWPWWYGETVRFRASSVTAVMIPFHMPVRWIWRFYNWIRWNQKDNPMSLTIDILKSRIGYLESSRDRAFKFQKSSERRYYQLENDVRAAQLQNLAGTALIPSPPRDIR